MAITRPVKNAGEKYVYGLNLAWASGTTVTATAGGCRDRKSVVQGKSVDLGGRRIIKKKTKLTYW